MFRIDNATASETLEAATAAGPNPDGYFTEGDPGTGVPATQVGAEFLNMMQEELAHVIEDADAGNTALSKADRTQLKASIAAMISASIPAAQSEALLTYEAASGSNGGSTTSGSWQTRALNTEKYDAGNIVTLAANQFTLEAGTYVVDGAGVFIWKTDGDLMPRLRIRNVTDAATVAISTSVLGNAENTTAHLEFSPHIAPMRFTIAAQKTFEFQYWVNVAQATIGLGQASSSGESEMFAWLHIRKVV